MEISNRNEYALLAMLNMATHYSSGEPLQIRQIALQQHIPERYLEQILAALRRSGLISSERGAKGGYRLATPPHQIKILDIINCMQGIELLELQSRNASAASASQVIREVWQEANQAANMVLKRYTLQDLVEQRNARQMLHTMYYI